MPVRRDASDVAWLDPMKIEADIVFAIVRSCSG
jgi:hypothetical protein